MSDICKKTYDTVIIGGGPGGYTCANLLAQSGVQVALVESQNLGGTCLNRGCVPTKALAHCAEIVTAIKTSERFGIETAGEIDINYEKIWNYKNETVSTLESGVSGLLKNNGVDVLFGFGRIRSKGVVEFFENADGESSLKMLIEAKNIVIATGSVPAVLPVPGVELENVFNSDMILGVPRKFESIIIVGGGVIGLEFASIYESFGVKVTIVEGASKILPTLDREFGQSLSMVYKKRGMKIFTNALVKKIEKGIEDNLVLTFVENNKEQAEETKVSADAILLSIGRKANLKNLFSDDAPQEIKALELNRGSVKVDENYETSVKGIFAIGDVNGEMLLAHAAAAQGEFLAQFLTNSRHTVNLKLVPSCVYTSPEISQVGKTLDEAKALSIKCKSGKFPMTQNARTLIEKAERGFFKVVVEDETEKIIGVQIMGQRATDLIGEATLAIANGLTVSQMKKAMRPHPTFLEGIEDALDNACK